MSEKKYNKEGEFRGDNCIIKNRPKKQTEGNREEEENILAAKEPVKEEPVVVEESKEETEITIDAFNTKIEEVETEIQAELEGKFKSKIIEIEDFERSKTFIEGLIAQLKQNYKEEKIEYNKTIKELLETSGMERKGWEEMSSDDKLALLKDLLKNRIQNEVEEMIKKGKDEREKRGKGGQSSVVSHSHTTTGTATEKGVIAPPKNAEKEKSGDGEKEFRSALNEILDEYKKQYKGEELKKRVDYFNDLANNFKVGKTNDERFKEIEEKLKDKQGDDLAKEIKEIIEEEIIIFEKGKNAKFKEFNRLSSDTLEKTIQSKKITNPLHTKMIDKILEEKKKSEKEEGKGKIENGAEIERPEWEKQIDLWVEEKIKKEMKRRGCNRAESKDNVSKKFKRVFLKRIFKDFAVHGTPNVNKEGQRIISRRTDLDSKACLGLMGLAGWEIKYGGEETNVSYVDFSERLHGKVVHLDVGKYKGIGFLKEVDQELEAIDLSEVGKISKQIEKSGGKKEHFFLQKLGLIIDHHPEGAPSTAGILFKILNKLDMFCDLEIKQIGAIKKIEKMVNFIDLVDSQGFQKIGDPNHFQKSDRTILGLHRYLNFNNLWKFFQKEDGNYTRQLKDNELRKYGLIYSEANGEKINRQEQQRKVINASNEKLKELKEGGFIIETNFGKIVVDIDGRLAGGASAAQSIKAGYLKWDSMHKTLYLFSNKELKKNLFDKGNRVREWVWVMPAGNGETGLTLKKVIEKIGGKVPPKSGLESALAKESEEEGMAESKKGEIENLKKEIGDIDAKIEKIDKKIENLKKRLLGLQEIAEMRKGIAEAKAKSRESQPGEFENPKEKTRPESGAESLELDSDGELIGWENNKKFRRGKMKIEGGEEGFGFTTTTFVEGESGNYVIDINTGQCYPLNAGKFSSSNNVYSMESSEEGNWRFEKIATCEKINKGWRLEKKGRIIRPFPKI